MNEIVPQALLFVLSGGFSYLVYGTEIGSRMRRSELGRAILFGMGTLLVLAFGTAYGAGGALETWVFWFLIGSVPILFGAGWADSPSANREAVKRYRLPEED